MGVDWLLLWVSDPVPGSQACGREWVEAGRAVASRAPGNQLAGEGRRRNALPRLAHAERSPLKGPRDDYG